MRHGETYLNKYNRMQGWSDTPLTPRGRRDVMRSGAGLGDVKFDAVYCSDLRRTFETAQIILKENQHADYLKVVAMPEFREIFFGSFEGRNFALSSCYGRSIPNAGGAYKSGKSVIPVWLRF